MRPREPPAAWYVVLHEPRFALHTRDRVVYAARGRAGWAVVARAPDLAAATQLLRQAAAATAWAGLGWGEAAEARRWARGVAGGATAP